MGLAVSSPAFLASILLEKSLTLICRIVQLGKGIGQLSTADIELKAIHQGRVRVVFSRQRGNLQSDIRS